MAGNCKRFHSCFVVDVSVSPEDTVITDSTRCKWHVDMRSDTVKNGFRTWFKQVFLKGIAQTLTVFEYEERGEGVDAENVITKFYGLPEMEIVNG